MSKFSKYLIDNSDKCTLTFQSDNPVTEFKATRLTTGLINTSSTSHIIWKINIQGFDENNNLTYQNEITGSGRLILFNVQFGLIVQKCSAVLTILNPEVIRVIYGFYYNSPFYLLNHDGYAKMNNLYSIGSYGARYKSTSSVLFDILPNLITLSWKSPDINSFDDRFFQTELTNLTNLVLDFSFQPNTKAENLKKAPNLLTLDCGDSNKFKHGHDVFLEFDRNFDYQIKNYHIRSRYNPLETIHKTVAYLPLLENFSTGGGHCGIDLTFPLRDDQDNTVLKTITLAWVCIIFNNPNTDGREYIYPQNIERLTALEYINNYSWVRKGDGADLFDKFHTMFYSKIYNETDNTKEGFTISLNSTYFQSLIILPIGFVHPSFRKHTMTLSASHCIKTPLIYTNKYNEINATGFELITHFES